jgi:phosphoribosyl 1,2-cyclic phosphate phosphodiesterase
MTDAMGPVRATLLGTGTSTGIPVPACSCEVCTSSDPKDNRLRCSCLIEVAGLSILVDAGPDFRTQCLRYGIDRVDAVLITHEHFDHVAGLDDLRAFLLKDRSRMPVYASPRTADVLRDRLAYIFVDGSYPGVPNLQLVEVDDGFQVKGRSDAGTPVEVRCVDVFHGTLPIVGFRIGSFAYVTDASQIPESSLERLQGVDTLILSALRHEPHPTHFTFDEAVAAAHLIGARKTYFIHMTHSILHARDGQSLPKGVELGYDGLVVEVEQ